MPRAVGCQAADGGLHQVELAVVGQVRRGVILGHQVVVERLHGDGGVVRLGQAGVGVLVDGDGQHGAAPFLRIGRDVGAAAGEADAQGCLGSDDHSRPIILIRSSRTIHIVTIDCNIIA